MQDIFAQTTHRPYPLPAEAWVMRQTWYNLLFAHWPVPVAALRAQVPAPLELDTFDGQAWLGVVPFGMRDVHPRYTFPVPGLSDFLELNVRTYVKVGGRPGVFFFSLDAANLPAVIIARAWYRLPYFHARMTMRETGGGWIEYESVRVHGGAPPAMFQGRYRPVGDVWLSAPGSLEAFLTERYCLYTVADGGVYRGEIHHVPWPLQHAEAEIAVNTMAKPHGLRLEGPPHLLFARRIATVEWPIRRVVG